MRILAKILKGFAIVWGALVALSVLVGGVGILVFEGWWKFVEIFSPFNWVNYVFIIALLSPALGAYLLHERLKKKLAR